MEKFKGIITPIITPFNKHGGIFLEGIENEIRYLHRNNIENLFICGSYGAFPLLSTDERKLVAEVATRVAQKFNMRSIVQIGALSTGDAVELAKHAEYIGADAISAVVPFYYSSTIYREYDFVKYFDDIISSVDIDVHCYNNPGTTGVNISPDVLSQLIDLGLTGIKDGNTNMGKMLEMINTIRNKGVNFDYYPSSTASFITGFLLGAKSCISGLSLTVPSFIRFIYNNMYRNSVYDATRKWQVVMKVRDILGKRCGRAIAAYTVLNSRGIDVGTCRLPWRRLRSSEAEDMMKELSEVIIDE
jgi:dihydrodipicolinate synthase/N-acetylneuraminate lyase